MIRFFNFTKTKIITHKVKCKSTLRSKLGLKKWLLCLPNLGGEPKPEKNLLCFKRKQMRLSHASGLANTNSSFLLPSPFRSSCFVLCFPFLCSPNCNVLYKNSNAQSHVLWSSQKMACKHRGHWVGAWFVSKGSGLGGGGWGAATGPKCQETQPPPLGIQPLW